MKTDTPETSPRPWSRSEKPIGDEYWIAAANQLYVGMAHTDADAALIVEAVNAYDALRKENATLNEVAVGLQRSRANIIADNDRLREALREIVHVAADAMTARRKGIARARSVALVQIYKFAGTALGEEDSQ